MISDLKEAHIKELSCVFDQSNRPTYVTLYFDTRNPDVHFVEKRKNACRTVLKSDHVLLNNFDKTISRIEPYLNERNIEQGQHGLVVFASEVNGFFKILKLPVPVQNQLIVETSPYIKPLAELLEEYETFGIILLDSHRAKIYTISSGVIEDEDDLSEDIMNKHKKGGWSQARFQRLRKGAIDHFLKEVTDDAVHHFTKDGVFKIIIAGPGDSKIHLFNNLPFDLKSKVIGRIDVGFDDAERCIFQKAEEIVQIDEKGEVSNNVIKLQEEILCNGLAVYGIHETIDAVIDGKVTLLLISKGYQSHGWKCEKCQLFGTGSLDFCPECHGKVAEIDAVDEAVKFAERTDSKIEFVTDNPVLKDLGCIGGLLRFN